LFFGRRGLHLPELDGEHLGLRAQVLPFARTIYEIWGSSDCPSSAYGPQTQVLEVEFTNGRIMSYRSVSAEVYRQFVNAPSPVSFFEDKIAENYPETEVR
jgi:hypothetical protein